MRNLDDIYPLSPLQEGILFHALGEPERGVYVIQFDCVIDGDLSRPAFREAWTELIARHPVLRTAFLWQGLDEPLQAVRQRVELPWQEEDWRGLAPAGQAEALARLLRDDRDRGFELARAPLLQVCLMRVADRSYRLLWSFHHLILDGWSVHLLLRDLLVLYRAFVRSAAPEIPARRPYGDYIAWLQERDPGSAEAFWRRELAGFAATTRLDVGTPPRRSDGPDAWCDLVIRLDPGVAADLGEQARRYRLTRNTIVQAAWSLLLARYTGESDVAFGFVVSGRPAELAEAGSMIGLFINTLPLRVRLDQGQRVSAWLADIQARLAEVREHEHSPLVKVQEWSPLPGGTPLFESVFAFENYPVGLTGGEDFAGLAFRDLRMSERTSYPLSLLVKPGDGLAFRLLFDGGRYDPATAGRLLGHLTCLLEDIVRRSEAAVGDIALLSPGERHQVLLAWNDTQALFGRDLTVHQFFEAQARAFPEAVAVIAEERSLTYAQLDRLANQLAHRLITLGVVPGDTVGICLRRSLEMIPALLGVLKAGAAYVPLEPAFPATRMHAILSRLGGCTLLTQTPLLGRFEEWRRGIAAPERVLCLDPLDWARGAEAEGAEPRWSLPGLDGEPAASPELLLGPESLAYVIFTSGSTGAPKGVMERHLPVVNLIQWVNRTFGMGAGDRALFVTSLCFDLSVYDIFGLLAAGGSIRIATEREVGDPDRLVRILREEPVTFWDSAPAALQQLVPSLPAEAVESRLRLVFLSGDWIPVVLPDRIRATFPGARVVSLGGATEATIWSNVYAIGEVDRAWASIPYGRPIQNARYHVLDSGLGPCPIGVEGGLYIGGECLAAGYAGDPALTADRFLPDPCSPDPGARLYVTGDRARFWPDGTLEFRGRRDHQVKIRGFRVELGEIEAVLSHHPGVREAAVLALPNGSGDRQLVAYVVATAGAALGAGELRARMARSLPEYMVPASYVFLEALPVTPNGKLDRKALPAPGGARPELSSRYVEPGTPVESLLAGIWAEVLHKERIGVLDDFFELGGHSLLATQVAARVRQAFAVDIPLRSIFDAPTVAALARRVDAARRAGSGRDTLPVAPVRADTYPLSFMQQRLWFLARLEAGSTEYNLFTGLSITGPLDLARLARSIEEVVLRHAALRTTFRDEDGQPYQVVAPSIDLAVPVIDLAAVPAAGEGELRRLSAAAAGLPFDLSRGPLLRIWVLRRGPQEHVLLFGLHHIVADAWSMEILVREVISVYARSAEELPLPPLPVQYPDFACWQRQWLQGEVLDGLLSYWTRRLGGAVPAELPTDRPRSEMRSYRGARYGEEMPDALSADLRQLARREDCTVFMVLVAVLSVLLHRLTGETRIFVGTDAANRGLPELEGLIGLFVNQLVLDTDVSGNPSFRKLLRRVREGTLEAFDHQELPFDLLVQALRPGRDLGRTPLFQVKLIHRVAAPGDLPLPGFAASALDLRAEPARFDLAIFVTEVAERVRIDWIYATDLFDAGTIERLARLHGALLVGTLASPDARLSALAGTAAEGGRQPASAPAVKKTLGLWAVRPTPVPAKDETPEDISRGAAVAPRAVVEPT